MKDAPLHFAARIGTLASLLLLSGCAPVILATTLTVILLNDDDSSCGIPGEPVDVTFQGNLTFQKRPENPEVGGSTVLVPIRGARVIVLRLNCGVEKVAETTSDGNGDYTVSLNTPSGSVLRVAVLAERDDPNSPASIRNNIREKLVYSFESGDLLLTDEASQSYPVDLEVPLDCTFQLAGAFNLLEQTRIGFEAISVMFELGMFEPPDRSLTVFWELGDPEGTFFTVSLPGEDLNGDGQGSDPFLQFRGGANLCWPSGDCCHNTDHFDDGLVLHEFGHYVAHLYSRDDSPGGPHAVAELLDPRLAWSEGWADFFSALARNDPLAFDTSEDIVNCTWPCNYFQFSLESKDGHCNVALCCSGIGSEEAVGALLWDVFDSNGESEDAVQVPPADIFDAFEALRNRHFVYVGDFLEEIEGRVIPQQGAIRALAIRERMTDVDGVLLPYPDSFPQEVQTGNQVQASASGDVNGCDGFCMQFPENYIGSSAFYELQIPGSSGESGILTARLSITPSGFSCDSNLQLRIYNRDQSFFYTTDGQTGLSKEIRFRFDSKFARGTLMMFEVAGDIPDSFNRGQKASYELTVIVE